MEEDQPLLSTSRALAGQDPELSQAAAIEGGGLDTPIHGDHRFSFAKILSGY